MNISLKQSWNTIFEQRAWFEKILIGGMFCLVALFLSSSDVIFNSLFSMSQFNNVSVGGIISLFIIGLILWSISLCFYFLFTGYNTKYMHNIINKVDGNILPDWYDFKNIFTIGFKSVSLGVIYSLCFICVIVFFSIIIAFFVSLSQFFIFFYLIPICLTAIILMLIPLVEMKYAENLKFKEGFKISELFFIIKNNFWNYIILYFLLISISILLFMVMAISAVTLIGILLIPIEIFISQLIIKNIFAQFYQEILIKQSL